MSSTLRILMVGLVLLWFVVGTVQSQHSDRRGGGSLLVRPPKAVVANHSPPISRKANHAPVPQNPIQTPPPLILDLSRVSLGAAGGPSWTSPDAVAKLGTILAVLHGVVFRFRDGAVLSWLDISETDANRRLIRRAGRRVLALGLAAYNLFVCRTSPTTAVATIGTVLSLDRLSRPRKVGRVELDEKRKWNRFMDQFKIHTYSILAWSGVLQPIVPWIGGQVVKPVGTLLGVFAVKDVLFPNDYVHYNNSYNERTSNWKTVISVDQDTAVLCQSSGYNMAALATFVLALPFSSCLEGAQHSKSLFGFGLAWIANLYSVTCLFPYVVVADENDHGNEEDEESDSPKTSVFRRRLRKAFYFAWLLAHGVIAATLTSSFRPMQEDPSG